jgi:hypothetical protein
MTAVSGMVLQGSGIMPIIGQLVARRVPKHVRMNCERQLCGFSNPGDRFQETRSRSRTTALGDENVSRLHIFAA